jgi:hypothetical protein
MSLPRLRLVDRRVRKQTGSQRLDVLRAAPDTALGLGIDAGVAVFAIRAKSEMPIDAASAIERGPGENSGYSGRLQAETQLELLTLRKCSRGRVCKPRTRPPQHRSSTFVSSLVCSESPVIFPARGG